MNMLQGPRKVFWKGIFEHDGSANPVKHANLIDLLRIQ